MCMALWFWPVGVALLSPARVVLQQKIADLTTGKTLTKLQKDASDMVLPSKAQRFLIFSLAKAKLYSCGIYVEHNSMKEQVQPMGFVEYLEWQHMTNAKIKLEPRGP